MKLACCLIAGHADIPGSLTDAIVQGLKSRLSCRNLSEDSSNDVTYSRNSELRTPRETMVFVSLVSATFIPYEIPLLLQEQPYKNTLSIPATSYDSTDIQPSTQSQPIFLIFESPSCMLSTGLHMIELHRGGSRILNGRWLIWGDTCTLSFFMFPKYATQEYQGLKKTLWHSL